MQPSGRQRRWRELVLASLLCCATGSTNAQPVSVAHPAGDYGNWSETEKWVWDRLKAGKVAVLDDRCADKKLDPAKNEIGEPHWLDRCRQITAHFLYLESAEFSVTFWRLVTCAHSRRATVR